MFDVNKVTVINSLAKFPIVTATATDLYIAGVGRFNKAGIRAAQGGTGMGAAAKYTSTAAAIGLYVINFHAISTITAADTYTIKLRIDSQGLASENAQNRIGKFTEYTIQVSGADAAALASDFKAKVKRLNSRFEDFRLRIVEDTKTLGSLTAVNMGSPTGSTAIGTKFQVETNGVVKTSDATAYATTLAGAIAFTVSSEYETISTVESVIEKEMTDASGFQWAVPAGPRIVVVRDSVIGVLTGKELKRSVVIPNEENYTPYRIENDSAIFADDDTFTMYVFNYAAVGEGGGSSGALGNSGTSITNHTIYFNTRLGVNPGSVETFLLAV